MKVETPILIDSNYLCYRAFFSTGGLRYNGGATGVIFGFLRDIQTLQDRFASSNLVFCFDHGKGLREKAHSFYKENRRKKKLSEDEEQSLRELKQQVKSLKREILPELGMENVLFAKGYEADDIIAKTVGNLTLDQQVVIVSGDKDLYQLLGLGVMMYNPRSGAVTNRKSFVREYGVNPEDWAMVKAIAGCSSDNIPGVPGVGEKTALKYMRNELDTKCASFRKIEGAAEIIERNLKLVSLPYKGCPTFGLKFQESVSPKVWKEVMDRLGIRSLKESTERRKGFDL